MARKKKQRKLPRYTVAGLIESLQKLDPAMEVTVACLIESLQKLDPAMEVMAFADAGMYVRLRTAKDVRARASLVKRNRFADDPKAPSRNILGIG